MPVAGNRHPARPPLHPRFGRAQKPPTNLTVSQPAPSTASRRPPRRPRVALLVETSLASGRDILRGIAKYAREVRTWSLFHEPRGLEESAPRWLADWKGDGIIARVQNPQLAEAVRRTGLPVVDVLAVIEDAGFPIVHVDDAAIGRMAGQHLHERGFRHFGFYGIADENWSTRRRDALRGFLAERKLRLHVLEAARHEAAEPTLDEREDRLAKWILGLPKAVGIVVCSDQRGAELLEACRRAKVHVPDEVAVVGVDNDEPLCEVSQPPLSSVWPDHFHVGYRAAALLDRLMHGQPAPAEPELVPPREVIARLSSDALAIADVNVAKALRFIREHGCEDISVDQVVRCSGLSRSVLQRRFRAVLGTTVHAEILNVRLTHACHLLAETDLTLIDIAERAGFKHQEYMGAVFKSKLQKTPGAYRKALRS